MEKRRDLAAMTGDGGVHGGQGASRAAAEAARGWQRDAVSQRGRNA